MSVAYGQPAITKTANYTITRNDYTVFMNASAAALSLTLPNAITFNSQIFNIKKTDTSSNTVTIITTNSQTIDGSANLQLTAAHEGVTVQSDGSNWQVIGQVATTIL